MPATLGLMLVVAAIAIGLILVVYGFHRLLMWAEGRGLVYYRKKPERRAPPLGFLAQIYKPEMEYVVEEESSEYVRGEDDESGRGDDDDPEFE